MHQERFPTGSNLLQREIGGTISIARELVISLANMAAGALLQGDWGPLFFMIR